MERFSATVWVRRSAAEVFRVATDTWKVKGFDSIQDGLGVAVGVGVWMGVGVGAAFVVRLAGRE